VQNRPEWPEASFTRRPDPVESKDLDGLTARLRLLKELTGASLDEVVRRIDRRRAEAGIPEPVARSTVGDCFKQGRRRPDEDLVVEIVHALDEDPEYAQRWRDVLRALRGRSESASVVIVEQLPAAPGGFIGREAELNKLIAAVHAGSTEAGCVVDGMAGSGKTSLVLHAAHRMLEQGTFDQALYINLRGVVPDRGQAPADPMSVLSAVLRRLGVPAHQIPRAEHNRRARYAAQLTTRRLLLVLDNAASTGQVQPLLPTAPGSFALVTTRRSMPELSGAHRLHLEGLLQHEASRMLMAATTSTASDDAETAASIAILLGGLPLALVTVTSRLERQPDWTLGDHLDRLIRQYETRLPPACSAPVRLQQLRRDRVRLAMSLRIEQRVQTAFDLSYEQLTAGSKRLLRVLSLHPGPDFRPADAVVMLGQADEVSQGLDELVAGNLLMAKVNGRYELHDLIRSYAFDRAQDEERPMERRAVLIRLLEHYRNAVSAAAALVAPRTPGFSQTSSSLPAGPVGSARAADRQSAMAWLNSEQSNLLAATVHAASNDLPRQAYHLAEILHPYLILGAHYEAALTVGELAVDMASQLGSAVLEAYARYRLSIVYRRLGRYPDALDHGSSALEALTADGDSTGRMHALKNLGLILQNQGRLPQAIETQQQVLELARAVEDELNIANTLGNLGILHDLSGDYRRALEHYGAALASFGRRKDRVGEAKTLDNIGIVLSRLGLHDQALHRHRLALIAGREISDQFMVANTYDHIGNALLRAERPAAARRYLDKALTLRRGIGDRSGEGASLDGLAVMYAQCGMHQEARAHHEQALTIAEEIGNQILEARTRNGLAEALLTSDAPGAALCHALRARELSSQIGDRYELGRALDNVGRSLSDLGDHDAARTAWQEATIAQETDKRRTTALAERLARPSDRAP
jgi:tetratricopeptide (TPR) repeat protein